MADAHEMERGQSFLDSVAAQIASVTMVTAVASPGADNARLERLASLSPIEYDREREAEAKALGVRSSTLDKLVKGVRQQKNETEGIDFDDVETWPHPVEPAALLSDLSGTIRRFIVCPDETSHAAALWMAMTWFMDVVQVAPLAIITAPEKRDPALVAKLDAVAGRVLNKRV